MAATKRLLIYSTTAAAITLALYARSLVLPFYSDDLVQIPWLRDLSFGELWGQVSPYGYYRPLAFSIWIAIREVGLVWSPAGLRVLNLVMHSVSAVMAGWLASEIDPGHRPLGGLFATLLFAAYPFSYQAVPWVSAFFYPLATGLILLAAAVYLYARRTGSRQWLAISLAATVLAPFAHENGALAGLLIATAEIAWWVQSRRAGVLQRVSLLPLLHLAVGGVFLVLWFSLRMEGVSTLDLSAANLIQNATILSTGLSYPLAWIVGIGAPGGSTLQMILVWLLGAVSLVLLVWITQRTPSVIVFSGTWFLIAIGPVLITMRPDWLIDAPRFLYPAGAAAAIWWGIGLSHLAGERTSSQIGTVGLAVLAAVPGGLFAWQGVEWHLRGGMAIRDAVEISEAHPQASLLLVNLPDRLAASSSIYPFFEGGAILLPPQVPSNEVIGAHTGESRTDLAFTAGSILPTVDYKRTTYGELITPDILYERIQTGQPVLVGNYSQQEIRLREAGQRLVDYVPPQRPGIAYFERTIILWEAQPVVENGLLILRMVWEIPLEPEGDPTIFVHVVDASGAIAAQADGDPIAGLYPLQKGFGYAILEDVRYIVLPDTGPFTVYIGVWNPATGVNLRATGGDYPDGRVPVGTIP